MAKLYFYSVTLFIIALSLVVSSISEDTSDQSICSWLQNNHHPRPKTRTVSCASDKFQCLNGKCINRRFYCDNDNDCGDRSDLDFCDTSVCPDAFSKCRASGKCIPNEWICDGIQDCPANDDESKCGVQPDNQESVVYQNILKWLKSQKTQKMTQKWGPMVDKRAVVFYFANNLTLGAQKEHATELAYEVTIHLLSRLHNLGVEDIPSSDLASYLNAFLVMCLDPRRFEGLDIVQELRSRVEKQNYTNPYVLLSLCNAGDTITDEDKAKLTDAFWNKRRPFWTDIQALSVMALVCASKQPGNVINTASLQEMTEELKQHQYRNGTVEDLLTTALVLQALISADVKRDPDNFDEIKALNEIRKHQKTDGSFGDITKTYFATPIFHCKSLIDINNNHCQDASSEDEISALENLANRSGPKIRVQYSLWIGNEKTLERNLAVRIPENTSLYGIMEIAAELDSTFKFEYVVQNRKPYINALSGLRDDPERGKFWFLYIIQDGQATLATKENGQATLATKESPAEIIPKNNDHYVMWYRRGTWNEF